MKKNAAFYDRGRKLFCEWLFLALGMLSGRSAADLGMAGENPLAIPAVGSYELRVLSPTMLELTRITTKAPDPAPVTQWNFVDASGQLQLPGVKEFVVTAEGQQIPVQSVGFKRRVVYAPLRVRDLRIGNYLYLQLARAVPENQTVEVKNPGGKLWPAEVQFRARTEPQRWSPAIHVNQEGYLPELPKKAMVGYFLGSLGELDPGGLAGEKDAGPAKGFKLLESSSGRVVYEGRLARRPDAGFTFPCYQQVFEADFSVFKTPGTYRLQVPGLGASFPFRIEDGIGAVFARTYALGIYHQRCGTNNVMPYTRFTHGPCHTAPAQVPVPEREFTNTWRMIASKSPDAAKNPRHTAPILKSEATCLYPFIRKGAVDVSGGHHDAGDYSKYTINSAAFVHHLVFAADLFPGVVQLDNLGLPESGDGKSDVLQEAKWEADYIAKMQDEDGGFYFLVYPRNREYESDVTPDHGDPQVVWPKTTAVTAASVAALAQCASSPEFKKQFPQAAAAYLEQARKGWTFLQNAITKYGKDGAYQKITHYGDMFMHDDELAWAACEMFLATGDEKIHRQLLEWFNPADPNTRRWGWWRLYESYGNAIRSYAFAEKTGRIKANQLDLIFLNKCQDEIALGGEEQFRRARDSAYGTSFPLETKRTRSAGWYFSEDAAFDLAVALQLDYPVMNDPRPKLLDALVSNLNYAAGCNPVNVCYLTGLGWKRQRCVVDQYALNDGRIMPPPGILIGNVQAGFGWLDPYKKELGALSYPLDGAQDSPYPFYDRWGDSFNVSTEMVIVNQVRALAVSSLLMAKTSFKNQPWKFGTAQITGLPKESAAHNKLTASLQASNIDLARARILWETTNQEPALASSYSFVPAEAGPHHVEAEAVLPDGRYLFAVTNTYSKRSR